MGQVIGCVERDRLVKYVASGKPEEYVTSLVSKKFIKVKPETKLPKLVSRLERGRTRPILVFDEDEFLGLISSSNLLEYMLIRAAERESSNADWD